MRADGTVKILDFGLAKALDPSPEGDPAQPPTLTAATTEIGMIMGTVAYMSPEQAKGKPVDKRADIWAFGVVLYEMLTGQKPFAGEDVSDTLASVLKTDPEWNAFPANTPARLRQLVQACLQKDPKQRVHDVADVRLAMEGAFENVVVPMTPEEPAVARLQIWQRPAPAVIAALALIAIGSVAVWGLTRPAPPRVVRFPIPLAADQAFSFTTRVLVAVSPDGSHVVYTANNSLWLRPVDQLQAVRVPGSEDASGPFFSADGQSIGFWADGRLKKVSVSGGAIQLLVDTQPDRVAHTDLWLARLDAAVRELYRLVCGSTSRHQAHSE